MCKSYIIFESMHSTLCLMEFFFDKSDNFIVELKLFELNKHIKFLYGICGFLGK